MAIAFNAAGTVNVTTGPLSFTVAAPAGTTSTDVCLIVIAFDGGTGVTFTSPSGWTLAKRVNDTTTAGVAVYWGLGSATFGDWAPSGAIGTVVGYSLGYTGVDNATPMDATAVGQTNAASTTITAPGITTVTANAWLVAYFAWYDITGGVPPATWSSVFGTNRQTGIFDASGFAGSWDVRAHDAVQAAAGASGAKTATVSSASTSMGFLTALRPSSGAADVLMAQVCI